MLIIQTKEILFERSTFTKILLEQKTDEDYKNQFYENFNIKDLFNLDFKLFYKVLMYKLKVKM
jgi:hypothetical protein